MKKIDTFLATNHWQKLRKSSRDVFNFDGTIKQLKLTFLRPNKNLSTFIITELLKIHALVRYFDDPKFNLKLIVQLSCAFKIY